MLSLGFILHTNKEKDAYRSWQGGQGKRSPAKEQVHCLEITQDICDGKHQVGELSPGWPMPGVSVLFHWVWK